MNIKRGWTMKYRFMLVAVFVLCMVFVGTFTTRAEDNKTIEFTDMGWPKILDDNKWTSQLIFDTVQACYQGTIRSVSYTHLTLPTTPYV